MPGLPRRLTLLDALAFAALLAAACGLAGLPLSHDDLFLHLRTGEWIVEHGRVPHADPFSFTRAGAPWVTHEWGFSLLAWLLWRVGGYPALLGAQLALVLALGWLVARRALATTEPARRGDRWLLAALLGLALWMSARELFLRAALASEVLLAATLLLLDRVVTERAAATEATPRQHRRGAPRAAAALGALFLAWGNLHSGVVFGLFAVAVWVLDALPRRRAVLAHLALAAGVAALSLLNPNGVEVWLYPLRLREILFASGLPWFLGHFGAPDVAREPQLLALLALVVAGVLTTKRRRAVLRPGEGLAILGFLLLLARSPRLLPTLGVLLVPVAYRAWAGRFAAARGATALRAALAATVIAALTWSAAAVWRPHPRRVLGAHHPEGAVRFLEAHRIDVRLFNHQNLGGYLLWRRHRPIFWDGRNDVFHSLVREVASTPFAEIAARYDVGGVLVTELEYRLLLPELQRRGWALVYWDDGHAIYLRRTPETEAVVAPLALRVVSPFGGLPGLGEVARDARLAALVRSDLDRMAAAAIERQRALYFRGVLSSYQGDRAAARRDFEAALAVAPNQHVLDALAGLDAAAEVAPANAD